MITKKIPRMRRFDGKNDEWGGFVWNRPLKRKILDMAKKYRGKSKPIIRHTPRLKTFGMNLSARPLPTWDRERFMLMAVDRGFETERGAIYFIAEQLKVPRDFAKRAFGTGRWKWEQMLVIGAAFEMTPKEFCDIFLNGYFRETRDGHYRCVVDNPMLLLYPPKTMDANTKVQRERDELESIWEEYGEP